MMTADQTRAGPVERDIELVIVLDFSAFLEFLDFFFLEFFVIVFVVACIV